MGGPVWHASGRGRSSAISRSIALGALAGVGDKSTTRIFDGSPGYGIVHVQRRLTDDERESFEIGGLCDVRGTDEGRIRLLAVLRELPDIEERVRVHASNGQRRTSS